MSGVCQWGGARTEIELTNNYFGQSEQTEILQQQFMVFSGMQLA